MMYITYDIVVYLKTKEGLELKIYESTLAASYIKISFSSVYV